MALVSDPRSSHEVSAVPVTDLIALRISCEVSVTLVTDLRTGGKGRTKLPYPIWLKDPVLSSAGSSKHIVSPPVPGTPGFQDS